jgi:type I restriction enzyme S subunit
MALLPDEALCTTRWQLRQPEDVRSGTVFHEGDVLLAKITPCLQNGKLGIARGIPGGWGVATTEVFPLVPRHVTPEFLALFLKQKAITMYLASKLQGATGRQRLPKDALHSLRMPVPPLAEQRAIAEVMLVVQRAKEATEKVIAALRELKKSLLKHLFTYGPVPFNQADKVPLKETEVGAIPEGWNVARLGDISDWMRYGTSRRCHPQPQGLPVLRIPNVINSSINTADLKFVEMDKKEADRYRLQVRDLLFVRTNGQREYVGRCAVYEGEPEHCLFASYLIGVRVRPDEVLADYIRLYALTPAGRRFLSGRASGAADGKFNINTQTLRSVMLPVPPIEMQRRIVHAVDAADAGMAAAGQRFTALEATFVPPSVFWTLGRE